MSRAEDGTLTQKLLLFAPQSPLDPLSSFVRKLVWDRFRQFIRVLVRGVTQEADLLSVPSAPPAKQHVQLHAEALENRQLVIERFRLEASDLFTIGRKHGHPSGEGP